MPPFTVRVVYVVPRDAEPWGEAKQRATDLLEDLQWFFADEMNRQRYGPKTFKIATDKDGTLLFHQIPSTRRKEEFKQYPMFLNNCKEAADVVDLRSANDVVIYFFEAYWIAEGKVSAGTRGH